MILCLFLILILIFTFAYEEEERQIGFKYTDDRLRDIHDGFCFVRRLHETDFERRPRCARMVNASKIPECIDHWTCRLNKNEKKIFSQNGEDGILLHLLQTFELGGAGSTYVEFGVEDGRECITRILREYEWRDNWHGLLLDGSHKNASINLYKAFISASNICGLFAKHKVAKNLTLLVVDIDFHDYHVLEKILQCGFVPKLIIVEYNASFGPFVSWTVRRNPISERWDGSDFFGASIQAFAKLGKRFDYTLLTSDSNGVNLFFAHNSLMLMNDISGLPNVTESYVASRYHRPKYGNGFEQRRRKWSTINNNADATIVELIAYESEVAMFSAKGHPPDWSARSSALV